MKSKIYYTAVGFPKRCLNSPANSVNWIEINRVNLIRAMIACSDRRQIILHGSASESIKNYFASKICMIDAFLKFDTNLCTSSLFSTLVSDERRIFSFNLGMALTKLYAEHVCNIPFLYDVSFLENHKLYGKKHSLKFNGTKRPDFIGLDGTGQWAVFESKGLLSNAFYNDINKLTNPAFEDTFLKVFRDKIAEATTQAISITHVGKQKIDINSVCINSITHERVYSYIKDPSSYGRKINIEKNDFIANYYLPFIYIRNNFPSSDEELDFAWGQVGNVKVGIKKDSSRRNVEFNTETRDDLCGALGIDGIKVKLTNN